MSIKKARRAMLAFSAMAVLACAPQTYHARLRPVEFPGARRGIDAKVELCLSEMRSSDRWEGYEGKFFIELGAQLARNSERLARAAFSEVLVTREGACGRAGAPMKITFQIESAERPLPYWDDVEAETSLEVSGLLVSADGERVWAETVLAKRSSALGSVFAQEARAAEDFGAALEHALLEQFEAITASEEIRRFAALRRP